MNIFTIVNLECDFKLFDMLEELRRVKINQSEVDLDGKGRMGRLVVFMYHGEYDPKAILDDAVSLYVQDNSYHQFISYEADNPWIRVVIDDVNVMYQKDFDPKNDRIADEIRR